MFHVKQEPALARAHGRRPKRRSDRRCSMSGGASAPARMGNQESQSRGRDPIDATRLPDGARTDRAELLPHFVGKARQGGIIEFGWKLEALIAPIGFHIRRLALHVDVVFGLDLYLPRDRRSKVAQ